MKNSIMLRIYALWAIRKMKSPLGLELGTPDRWIFQKSSWAYDESAPYYAFDKAKADLNAKLKELSGGLVGG